MAKSRKKVGSSLAKMSPPMTAWLDLTTKSSEIGIASGQTIMHRMLMMSGADMAALTAAERQEFTRMYTEKIQAAMAYGQIMAGEMMRLNQQIAMAAWSQFFSGAMAMAQLWTGGNPAGALAAQNRAVNAAARRASTATWNISVAMTRAMTQGLKPYHTRVSANAKRLGRKAR